MDRYEAPNAGAYVNGPVVRHFEDFGLRAYRPDARSYLRRSPLEASVPSTRAGQSVAL